MPLKVIELDMENRRLVLSVNAFFFSRDPRLQEEYIALHEQYMRDRIAKLLKKKAEHKTRERKRSPLRVKPPLQQKQQILKKKKPRQPQKVLKLQKNHQKQ